MATREQGIRRTAVATVGLAIASVAGTAGVAAIAAAATPPAAPGVSPTDQPSGQPSGAVPSAPAGPTTATRPPGPDDNGTPDVITVGS